MMYKRIIVVVASALFALLALLSIIITDLYDRDFPRAINVESRLNLNLNETEWNVTEAFVMLEETRCAVRTWLGKNCSRPCT